MARLLSRFKVSHLVGCKPYSKSVSIRDCGVDVRSLPTGSTNVSDGVIYSLTSSTNIESLSVADIDPVLYAKTIVVCVELGDPGVIVAVNTVSEKL